jgi:hypothetical protein
MAGMSFHACSELTLLTTGVGTSAFIEIHANTGAIAQSGSFTILT